MILAGDVGGTKTTLALYDGGEGDLRPRGDATFASREHDSLESLLADFLAAHPGTEVAAACIGVAGPVVGGRVATTNLPWQLDEATLARVTGAPRVKLLNDMEATAYGVLHLRPEDRAALNPGAPRARPGHAALIAAGTGLGEAILFWDGRRHHAIASEAGHVDFAPRDEREIELLRFMQREVGGRVSRERVVSGPGLHGIYRFLRERSGAPEPAWLTGELGGDDPSAAIARAASGARDPVCAESLELFVSLYGAAAGDLALHCLPAGGVFLAGGIAPKILPALKAGGFLRAFTDKGRFAELLSGYEVNVALDPRAPLLGAAHCALAL